MAPSDANVVLVLTTVPLDFDAEALARELLARRLVACVNVLPSMRSLYRWKGVVESAHECQLLAKTHAARVPALRAAVAELHPYDVPEFLVLPVVDGGEAYLRWVLQETAAPRGPDQ
jgi:periplasmic divalent cation tolerance protein